MKSRKWITLSFEYDSGSLQVSVYISSKELLFAILSCGDKNFLSPTKVVFQRWLVALRRICSSVECEILSLIAITHFYVSGGTEYNGSPRCRRVQC